MRSIAFAASNGCWYCSFYLLKITEPKGRNATQSIPTKKRRDPGDKDHSKNASNNFDAESFSSFSSRASAAEKDREELVMLKEQVEDLQKKISEKDELLKSAEISKNQMNAVQVKLDELKHQAEEKDSLIKSTQRKLSDAKVPNYCLCCFTSILNLSSVYHCGCWFMFHYLTTVMYKRICSCLTCCCCTEIYLIKFFNWDLRKSDKALGWIWIQHLKVFVSQGYNISFDISLGLSPIVT